MKDKYYQVQSEMVLCICAGAKTRNSVKPNTNLSLNHRGAETEVGDPSHSFARRRQQGIQRWKVKARSIMSLTKTAYSGIHPTKSWRLKKFYNKQRAGITFTHDSPVPGGLHSVFSSSLSSPWGGTTVHNPAPLILWRITVSTYIHDEMLSGLVTRLAPVVITLILIYPR